ncbi:RNA polymerase sigma (SigX) subunit [Melghiribacillus thermohalophilus]|uniref:RNA polymerase sigma factor n=1 Tax=Melghiribacillus thermohalophilus TaxID=1324956 RepID=A0A4V2V2L8_9BACI|nr:RNA polymerase sigma factor SigX [Melghiribacillus thermohalophilus]TCT25615.1 RNA polymerase sigma (SigX) subunit [Melghiribacillus thermohalophilus]
MKDVFHELYQKYHQDLFQFLFYMVKNREIAEDLVQEVYIKVLKSYHSFEGKSSEKTWLFSVARHVAIDYFRKQKRKKKRFLDYFDIGEKAYLLQDEQPIPEEIAVQNDEIKQVYHYLGRCTDDQQSVIILRFIQSLSIQETAEVLGWSVSKVKTTQHRAMKALKTMMLEGEGVKREAK